MPDSKPGGVIEVWTRHVMALLSFSNKTNHKGVRMLKQLMAPRVDPEHGTITALSASLATALRAYIDLPVEPRPLTEEDALTETRVRDLRPALDHLLNRMSGILTWEEQEMFHMARALIKVHVDMRQFEDAGMVTFAAWHRALDIQDDGRMLAAEKKRERDAATLEGMVRAASQRLGRQLEPWTPVLGDAERLQFLLFATLLDQRLRRQEWAAALGLLAVWAEVVNELPRQFCERILEDLEPFAEPAARPGPDSESLAADCQAIRDLLARDKTTPYVVVTARSLLAGLPALADRIPEAAREAAPEAPKAGRAVEGEAGAEIDRATGPGSAAAAVEAAVDAVAPQPRQIDDLAPLLRRCPPRPEDTIGSYQERADVVDFIGDDWIGVDAFLGLVGTLAGAAGDAVDPPGEPPPADRHRWTVVNDNPRVRFNDKSALERAVQIVVATKAGGDPRRIAQAMGLSLPTWRHNVMEIRLSQGATQLRMLSINLGGGLMSFLQIMSVHAPGTKQAGHLRDYFDY